jgi:hypothetical protein
MRQAWLILALVILALPLRAQDMLPLDDPGGLPDLRSAAGARAPDVATLRPDGHGAEVSISQ